MSLIGPMPAFLQLDRYRLPDRFYAGICPHAYRVRDQYDRWCGEMTNLSQAGRERYRKQNLSYAASRCFPHPASYDRALACALDVLWMTLFDDHHGLSSVAELTDKRDRVLEIFQGRLPQPGEYPLLQKIADFRELCASLMPQHWLDRYTGAIDDYFRLGIEREAAVKLERRIPSVAEVEEIRTYTIAMFPWFRMAEVALDLPLPDHIAGHPAITRIEHLLARVEIWQNDAFSLLKESQRVEQTADVFNLAFALQHQHNLSLDDACTEMLRIHDADVAEFVALADSLPDFGPHQRDVEAIVHHLAITVTGLETWYRTDTARYAVNGTWVDEYASSPQPDTTPQTTSPGGRGTAATSSDTQGGPHTAQTRNKDQESGTSRSGRPACHTRE